MQMFVAYFIKGLYLMFHRIMKFNIIKQNIKKPTLTIRILKKIDVMNYVLTSGKVGIMPRIHFIPIVKDLTPKDKTTRLLEKGRCGTLLDNLTLINL